MKYLGITVGIITFSMFLFWAFTTPGFDFRSNVFSNFGTGYSFTPYFNLLILITAILDLLYLRYFAGYYHLPRQLIILLFLALSAMGLVSIFPFAEGTLWIHRILAFAAIGMMETGKLIIAKEIGNLGLIKLTIVSLVITLPLILLLSLIWGLENAITESIIICSTIIWTSYCVFKVPYIKKD